MGEVATIYTLEFVRRHLPELAARVLEVGCGNGELAAVLQANGLEIVALDSDEACVATAKASRVDGRMATWPCTVEGSFDAVLFTRSLHHIQPLDAAIDAAVAALRPGGRILVEDFRFELDSKRAMGWFMGLMGMLAAAGLARNEFGRADLKERLDFGERKHELHSSLAIAAELGKCGAIEEQSAAYYFRYAEPHLDEATTRAVLDYELEMIAADVIDALGARFVLTPSN